MEEVLKRAAVHDGMIPQVLYRVAVSVFRSACENPRFFLLMLALFYSGRKSDGFQTVYPFVERYYRLFVGIFEQAADELGNMHGRQKQFAVGFMGVLHYYLLLIPQDGEGLEGIEVPERQIYELVRQFMYAYILRRGRKAARRGISGSGAGRGTVRRRGTADPAGIQRQDRRQNILAKWYEEAEFYHIYPIGLLARPEGMREGRPSTGCVS